MQRLSAQTEPAIKAGEYYKNHSFADRTLVNLRPYICPFKPLVGWVPSNANVFDIGCGTGLWLITLANSVDIKSGIGVDINSSSIRKAKLAVTSYKGAGGLIDLNFQQTSDSRDWPKEDRFDVVSLVDVLHHIPASIQAKFIGDAIQMIKPGGRLLYKDMSNKPWVAGLGNRLHDLVLARQWINYFPISRVAQIATSAGGKVRYQDNWQRAFYAHELLVVDF
jgi:2-polyprenyl-3-methyl-5-hydroxy-6-metoxy-1,4-benzoquinol methylase